MKGIILSAGQGSRLLPLTATMPKCLVEVGGASILDHQLHALAAAGMGEAVIVGGYRIGQIAEHLEAARPPLPTRLVFNPFWAVASSIGSVWAARPHLDGDFCLMNGDTVFDAAVIADAGKRAEEGVSLLIDPVERLEPDDMRVAFDHGLVGDVAKHLAEEATTHRSLGVILARGAGSDRYRTGLETVIAGPNGTMAYHHAIIAHIAREGMVHGIVNRGGCWREVDRPEDIESWMHDHEAAAR
ncbi:phosphocholine cytidylyltransferase family protein [Stakelama saccharophila]|uniref:Phosphocholine cytidylyltransferase family protein n=1 Tax=Stakelama saccharophila TaxID=3075605 RepID=A0ABZ0B9V2_9SPHN|nr:phosphocholine cytidylyltransferase family protein [Stakelama sp. W311]WNO54063.1 phosphocholine cytidylyltransferase family protein [Stakelama sp. W311]